MTGETERTPPQPGLLRSLASAVEAGCSATDPAEWPEAVWLTSQLDSPLKAWHAVISLPDGVPDHRARGLIRIWAELVDAREVLEFGSAGELPCTIMAVASLTPGSSLEVCICPAVPADATEEPREAVAIGR